MQNAQRWFDRACQEQLKSSSAFSTLIPVVLHLCSTFIKKQQKCKKQCQTGRQTAEDQIRSQHSPFGVSRSFGPKLSSPLRHLRRARVDYAQMRCKARMPRQAWTACLHSPAQRTFRKATARFGFGQNGRRRNEEMHVPSQSHASDNRTRTWPKSLNTLGQ